MQGPAPGSRIRTLVVDDSPPAMRALCSVLSRQARIEIIARATSGQRAVELARELQPDLVVMDVQMLGMNGLEATQLITRSLPATKVILTSVDDSPALQRECLKAGAVAFIAKSRFAKEFPKTLRAGLDV